MSIPVIAITNQSTVLNDSPIEIAVAAIQKQLTQDFYPYYDKNPALTILNKYTALPMGWSQIVIVDNPDQAGALGYHELNEHGYPLGKVFAKLDLDSGVSWTVTLSHEILEMVGDPDINLIAEGGDGKLYAMEVGDPVEADELGYIIDNVLVSDFVLPSWFQAQREDNPPVDFKKRITKPFELAKGGYISIRGADGNWTQVNAQTAAMGEHEVAPPPPGSRRDRRNIPVADRRWSKSEKTGLPDDYVLSEPPKPAAAKMPDAT